MRKAIVDQATGLVLNIIEIEPDDGDGYDHWTVPDGAMMLDDGPGAQPGATWDGNVFLPLPVIPPSRETELRRKIIDNTATPEEYQELMRIRFGLQPAFEAAKASRE